MFHEKSCGAIVYRKYHGNTEILLIKHINSGHWSFPKGHVEAGESEAETARREIKEETNFSVAQITNQRHLSIIFSDFTPLSGKKGVLKFDEGRVSKRKRRTL